MTEMYISITHLDEFGGYTRYRVGQELELRKDKDNLYDDEAIAIFNESNLKCGYVSNSVGSVARGTKSAGRIYDKIGDRAKCDICFITDQLLIARVNN